MLFRSIDIEVPDSFYQRFLDYFLERSYLNDMDERTFTALPNQLGNTSWLRITHLPVNPGNDGTYDLLARWQSVLSTMHAWNYRVLFLLLRNKGETHLYIGTTSLSKETADVKKAAEQLREAAVGSMPGIGLSHMEMTGREAYTELIEPLMTMPDAGAVTGIPSFRETEDKGRLQTLDSLAFGIRDNHGMERKYALLVVADPLRDGEVAGLISRLRELGSKIHSGVSQSVNEAKSSTESKEKGLGGYGSVAVANTVAPILGSLASMIPYVGPVAGALVSNVARVGIVAASAKTAKNISVSNSSTVTTTLLDKYAEYTEKLIDRHIDRLKEGRNLGFWNTGVYVLGNTEDIRTVTGMLRSVYSGKESYIEPIRTHLFDKNSGAKEIITNFDLLPLVNDETVRREGLEAAQGEWHILGRPYQYLSTPMNTAELSLTTSLPRRDVPGLRFVKTAVRFASNPAEYGDGEKHAGTEDAGRGKKPIRLGNVVDMGVEQNASYLLSPDVLVRHAFVCGVTGSGKTTTCKHLLSEVMERNIPVLIIEPAKDDYVRWAVEKNKDLPPDKRIQVYMPGGTKRYEGAKELRLNLFEPAAVPGANVDLLQRGENLSMLLNACLPSEEVIPILIDETVHRKIEEFVGDDFDSGDMPRLSGYPTVEGLIQTALAVMDDKSYESKVKENFKEILLTRFKFLMRGVRGSVFNVLLSTDYEKLFSRPTVINLSRLAGSKEKSLVMSLLLLALYEYRTSAYQNDDGYRAAAQENRLMHLTLIEEAHNVLSQPPQTTAGDPRQAAAELFGNILSEIRGYGEGLLVVDQTPVKLIPDVIKNTNLKICHRLVAPDDCAVLSASMALREDQEKMIPSLEIGNAIICGDMDDAAAWVKLPAPKKEKAKGR